MKRGRKPLNISKTKFSVWLPDEIVAKIKLLLLDPVRERSEYGSVSAYIERLVRADLDARNPSAHKPQESIYHEVHPTAENPVVLGENGDLR